MSIIILYKDKNGFGVEFTLCNAEFTGIISIFFCTIMNKEEYKEFLSESEVEQFKYLNYEKRINSYLFGRISAKKAIGNLVRFYNYREIEIENGIFNQPYVVCERVNNKSITISHCDKKGVAVAFSEKYCIGVDIEEVDEINIEPIISQCTNKEIGIVNNRINDKALALTMIWCSKEALSKVMKTGLTISFEILELEQVQFKDGYIISKYKNFCQYKSITWTFGNEVCSLVLPKELLNDYFIKQFEKFLLEYKNRI